MFRCIRKNYLKIVSRKNTFDGIPSRLRFMVTTDNSKFKIALNNDDFPTFGLPIIVTKPDLNDKLNSIWQIYKQILI